MPSPETDYYFRRFGFCQRQIAAPPSPDLGIVVVIPCFNEPDLIGSLESLRLCERPNCSVEVIVVVNSPAGCSEEIRSQNQATLKAATEWTLLRREAALSFHLLHFPDLPPKQAGVGLARKIGMDEALRRFDEVGRLEGIIAGYDADCRCEPGYLSAIERHFEHHPQSPGCSIYFEHPLSGPSSPRVYEAVAAYELHLRYYVGALRYCGFPHAHQTLGSCMAVRSGVYRKQGGMNKRKAGEDFYFLHKIIPLGGFTDLTETAVFPSARPSGRVPFGTGRAVRAFLQRAEMKSYPLEAFLDLQQLFDCLPRMYRDAATFEEACAGHLPESIRSFLRRQRFAEVLKEIRGNTTSEAAFRRRFFQGFDGFLAMKFVHYARDCFYGDRKVEIESAKLLAKLAPSRTPDADLSLRELLMRYRYLDRSGSGQGARDATSRASPAPSRPKPRPRQAALKSRRRCNRM